MHERERHVTLKTAKLREAVVEITESLTVWETVRVVSDVLGGVLGNLAKYGIRDERHPDDPERPGGWA
jgi:hypothetical protein